MNNEECLTQIQRLENEIVQLDKEIEELQIKINEFKSVGNTSSPECQICYIYAKAKQKHKHILRQHIHRLRRQISFDENSKKSSKVPTFNYHFYHIAKKILDEELFNAIKEKANEAFELEKTKRKIIGKW